VFLSLEPSRNIKKILIDLALIVTEPTLSGIHDMERIADVTRHFGVKAKVVINKYDINLKNTQDIAGICRERNIEVLAQLPFSEDISKAIVEGVPAVEFCHGRVVQEISALWEEIR